MRTRIGAGQGCGVLFGRERWGLNNEEIGLADEIVTYPVNPAFASLNIAQAVLLMAYEWMKSAGADAVPFRDRIWSPRPSPTFKACSISWRRRLTSAAISGRPTKGPKMVDNMRAVLSRQGFYRPEIHLLRGVIRSLDRYTRRKPRGAAETEDPAS